MVSPSHTGSCCRISRRLTGIRWRLSLTIRFHCFCTQKGISQWLTSRSLQIRTSGDVLRNFGGRGVSGLRGTYERLLKLGYGFSIMASVPLIMDNFQVGVPMWTISSVCCAIAERMVSA